MDAACSTHGRDEKDRILVGETWKEKNIERGKHRLKNKIKIYFRHSVCV
jgi:hypothetical protein